MNIQLYFACRDLIRFGFGNLNLLQKDKQAFGLAVDAGHQRADI